MKVDPELEQALKDEPQANVAVIVHVQGDPAQYAGSVESLGLSVTRVFRLTNTLAVRGAAPLVSQLADQPWVVKIESDRQITTQR
jgi:hypothetical protein